MDIDMMTTTTTTSTGNDDGRREGGGLLIEMDDGAVDHHDGVWFGSNVAVVAEQAQAWISKTSRNSFDSSGSFHLGFSL
jgi:hypothetical protein